MYKGECVDTITFSVNHKDGQDNYNITFTVLKEFTEKYPNYLTTSFLELFVDCQIPRYWHNETGPAVVMLLNGTKATDDELIKRGFSGKSGDIYALNGKQMSEENILKLNGNLNVNSVEVISNLLSKLV